MRGWRRIGFAVVAVLCGATILAAAVLWRVAARGFSARDEPSAVEAFVAQRLRRLSIPRSARDLRNPISPSEQVLSEAMAHYADHCAICHANDGSGGTAYGLGLYPPPPDLRQPGTQRQTDGELFYTIHNGIRFTGMPAFGDEDPKKDEDSWKLVHFIRYLPKITPEELDQMDAMNPRSPMQIRMEEEMKKFLEGDEAPAHTGH